MNYESGPFKTRLKAHGLNNTQFFIIIKRKKDLTSRRRDLNLIYIPVKNTFGLTHKLY